METPEVEMGDNTGAAEESWEGLGAEDKEDEDEDEDKEGAGEGNEDEDESEDEDSREDLVSEISF